MMGVYMLTAKLAQGNAIVQLAASAVGVIANVHLQAPPGQPLAASCTAAVADVQDAQQTQIELAPVTCTIILCASQAARGSPPSMPWAHHWPSNS